MSSFFIDTSSLFKRYIKEEGTDKLDDIFSEKTDIYISDLTVIEILSNLKRKCEVSGEIDEKVYAIIKTRFLKDISKGILISISTTSKVIVEGISLIDQKYLTPIEALQLATALHLNRSSQSIIFVCSDLKLAGMAGSYGLDVMLI